MGWNRYTYLAYCSSETISLSIPLGWARGCFTGVSDLLESVGIQMDRLLLLIYSFDAPGHHLPTKQKLNRIIKDDIYKKFIQTNWVTPQGGLRPKMAFYVGNFLEPRDRFIVQPHDTLCHWIHALRIPLDQFRVGSHRLHVDIDHQIDRSNKTCHLGDLQEVKTEEHFSFCYPIYYEIRGRFHCLFRGIQTLIGLLCGLFL